MSISEFGLMEFEKETQVQKVVSNTSGEPAENNMPEGEDLNNEGESIGADNITDKENMGEGDSTENNGDVLDNAGNDLEGNNDLADQGTDSSAIDDGFTGGGVMDYGFMGDDMMDGSLMGDVGTETKDAKGPLLSKPVFVVGVTCVTFAVAVILGLLLAKRRIKKGIDLYENY